jgi:pyruvate kinase
MDDMIQAVEQSMLETGLVNYGQQVIVTCGYPILNHHATNLALLHTIRKPS